MKYASSLLSFLVCTCALFGSRAAQGIRGPRWVHQGGAAEYYCPSEPAMKRRVSEKEVTWRLGSTRIYSYNFMDRKSQPSEHTNELVVDESASYRNGLVVKNVSITADGARLSCEVLTRRPDSATYSYSTLLNVTYIDRTRVHVDNIHEDIAVITCLIPVWREFRGLTVNDKKPSTLVPLNPASAHFTMIDISAYAPRVGNLLSVACSSSYRGKNETYYHYFEAVPDSDHKHMLLEELTADPKSHSVRAGGCSLMLVTSTLLLWASRRPGARL